MLHHMRCRGVGGVGCTKVCVQLLTEADLHLAGDHGAPSALLSVECHLPCSSPSRSSLLPVDLPLFIFLQSCREHESWSPELK